MSSAQQHNNLLNKRKFFLSKQSSQLSQQGQTPIKQNLQQNNLGQNNWIENQQQQQQNYSGSQRKYRTNSSKQHSFVQNNSNNNNKQSSLLIQGYVSNKKMERSQNQQQQQKQLIYSKQNSSINDSFKQNQSGSHFDLNQNYMKLRTNAYEFLSQGDVDSGLNLFVQSIEEAAESIGESNLKFELFFKQSVQMICQISMQLLSQKKMDNSLEILFRIEEFITDSRFSSIDQNLKVLVLNNIGCIYKRHDSKLQESLKYLEKAEKIIHEYHCYENAGITYLNLGALYSKLKNYEESLSVTKRAYDYFKNEINELKNQPIIDQKLINQKARHLAITSLNIGANYEVLENYEDAVKNYEDGQQIILPISSLNDPLNTKFQRCIAKCRAKQSVKKNKGTRTLTNTIVNNNQKQLFRPYSGKQSKSTTQFPQVGNIQQYQEQSPSNNNEDQFYNTMPQQQFKNFEKTKSSKKKAPRVMKQNYFSDYEDIDNFQTINNNSNSKIFGRNTFQNQGIQSSVERGSRNSKDLGSDLEKMGIQDWKDSDQESQEDEFEKTKRLNFLKSMNNYDNGIQTQKIYKPSVIQNQQDLHENPFKTVSPNTNQLLQVDEQKQYDEDKIIFLQKLYRKNRDRKSKGKAIQEQARKRKNEYLQQKALEKQRQYETEQERIKREEEEKELEIAYNKKREEKAIYLQQFYRKKRNQLEIRQQTREKAQIELKKRQQIKENKSAIVIQSNFRMFKERNNYLLQNMLGKNAKNRKDKYKTKLIKKFKTAVRYIEKKTFEEWDDCQVLYTNLTVYLQEKILTQEEAEAIARSRKTSYNYLNNSHNQSVSVQNQGQYGYNQNQNYLHYSSQQKKQMNTENSYQDSVMSSDQDVYQSYLVFKVNLVKGQNVEEILKSKRKIQQCILPIQAQRDPQFKYVMEDLNCRELNLNIQQSLIFFIDQILQLIYINNKNQLHLVDITDLDKIEKLSNNVLKQPTYINQHSSELEQAVILIQKHVRCMLAKEKVNMLKNDRSIYLYRVWNIKVASEGLTEVLVRCYLYHDQQQGKRFAAKNMQTNKYFVQRLEWSDRLMEEYPRPTNFDIEELIDFNVREHTMEFSEIAYNVLGKAQERQKLRQMQEINERLVIKVQAKFRANLARQNYLAIKDRVRELNEQKESELFVTQRLIYDQNETYNLRLYYFIDKEKKCIKITCTHMARIRNNQTTIPPYYQEMFPNFQENYLFFFGSALLEKAYIKKSRKDQQKKIGVPRIEEIMAEIKIQIKRQRGHKIEFQNSTLDARKIFNSMRLKMVYQQNNSLVGQLNIQGQKEKQFEFQEGEQYAKLIQDLYRKYSRKKRDNLEKTKVMNNDESLKDMAMKMRSQTYQFIELEKKDAIEKRVKQEGEVVKPVQMGDRILEDYEYNQPILRKDTYPSQFKISLQELSLQQQQSEIEPKTELTIKYQEQLSKELVSDNYSKYNQQQQLDGIKEKWVFDAYVQRLSNLLIIVGLRTYGEDERQEVLITQISLQQLDLNDAKNPQAQKKYIIEKILVNLRFKEGHKDFETNQNIASMLYYKEPAEDQEQKDKTEAKNQKKQILSSYEQLQKELKQDQSSLVKLQSYNNGHFQVSYEIQLKTMIILCTIFHRQDVRVKTEILYPLELFQCTPLKDMISCKNTNELHRFFKNILKQMTENLEITTVKVNGDQKIRHNQHIVKQMLPDILKNVFAQRLQNTIKTFRLKKIFSQVKNFLKSQEFFLFDKVQKNSSKYFKLSFFLLRNDYKLKLIVQRHPTKSSKQFSTGFEISLLKLKQKFDLSSKDTLYQIQKMREKYKKQQEEESQFLGKKESLNTEHETKDEIYLKQQFDYLKISEQEWQQILRLNRKAEFKQDPIFLTQNRWMDIQGIHSLVYYRNIFRDLVNYLDQNITFHQKYDHIAPEIKDDRIQLEQIKLRDKQVVKKKVKKPNSKVQFQFQQQQQAAMAIYKAYQRIKVHEYRNLRKESQDQRQSQIKQIGQRVKRAFKQIGNQRYIVNIYKKDNVYTFHLVNVLREKKRQQRKDGPIRLLKAVYEFDNNKLLNTKEKTIEDFLLDQLDMREPETKNLYDSQNNIIGRQKLGEDEGELFFKDFAYQSLKDQDSQENSEESETQFAQQQMQPQLFISQDKNLALNKELQEQNMGDGVPPNIASNLVDYVHQKDESGREMVYNVVYTGKRPKDIMEKKKQLLLQKGNGQTVKIDVDLGELKKLYPTLNLKSQELMKFIGEQLIEGIKVDKSGKIILDSNKINPHCINVTENLKGDEDIEEMYAQELDSDDDERKKQMEERKQLQQILEQKQREELQKQLDSQVKFRGGKIGLGGFKKQIRPKIPPKVQKQETQTNYNYDNESRVILLRDTRFFNYIKYLVRVYLIERQVNKIISSSKDQVFQEYETCYQIDSMNLTDKKQCNLTWEITPLEVAEISGGIVDKNEAARYLLKRLQIYNNQYILVVDEKVHASKIKPANNLVVFYAKGIQPIQIHFKNRTYRKNYHSFQTEMKQKKADMIWRGVPQEMKTLKNSYLLVCFQKNKVKKLEFVAFDLLNFQRYTTELDRNQFVKYLNIDKQETIKTLSKFFDIDQNKQQLQFNEGIAKEFLEKHFKDAYNQKLITAQSLKSQKGYNNDEFK